MDGLRLIQGTVTPGIGVGRDARVRLKKKPPKVRALNTRAIAAGGESVGGGGNAVETAAVSTVSKVPLKQSYMNPLRLWKLWPGGGPAREKESRESAVEEQVGVQRQSDNRVLTMLNLRSLWPEKAKVTTEEELGDGRLQAAADAGDRFCRCSCDYAEDKSQVFDQETFSSLLRRVSLVQALLYAKMSYLGRLAYDIPKMKPRNLKYHGMRLVTSSFAKRMKSVKSKEVQETAQDGKTNYTKLTFEAEDGEKQREIGNGISTSAASQITTASAAYVQSQIDAMLAKRAGEHEGRRTVTTNTVTAVDATKEKMKQAVDEDLNSAKPSPCEWYICDDENSATRYIVFQGSETLASWKANLLFEPVQFEGHDVFVHRGIYEAAKLIYKQILPEIEAHLKHCGGSAMLQFTGHSLGGSLAMLLNLMLLIRGDAPASSLLPVIMFGAPSVMCQGDYLLHKLGLPKSHIQAIVMHRDIVPRVFSCNCPNHVAKILRVVNGKFSNHPCLVKKKFIYAPMGDLLILQPEEKFSPHHHLLPPGIGLYILGNSSTDSDDSARLLHGAQSAFLNSPHPLEILSDRTAYGSKGTVFRDHDMSFYSKSLRSVIRDKGKIIGKAKMELICGIWLLTVVVQSASASVATLQHPVLTNCN